VIPKAKVKALVAASAELSSDAIQHTTQTDTGGLADSCDAYSGEWAAGRYFVWLVAA